MDQLSAFADRSENCAKPQRDNLYKDTEPARRLVNARDPHGGDGGASETTTASRGSSSRSIRYRFTRVPARARARTVRRAAAAQGAGAGGARGAGHGDCGVRSGRKADADLAALLREELRETIRRYELLKARAGRVDFLDLLLKTRNLVRDHAAVRADFQRRFTHLFVDEFQDTDPLQAEILLLLAADDPDVEDWRAARPTPGKLFLVGDPKQSIYRFRRADVGTYFEVRELLRERGAELVQLTTSFRSRPEIQRVINASFAGAMDGDREAQQAEWVPLSPFRDEGGENPGVVALPVPRPYGWRGRVTKTAIQDSLPDATAAFIEWLLNESGWRVSEREAEDVPIAPRHICLLFRRFDSWWAGDITRGYVDALEARGVRHLLVGGRSFHDREEVETLRTALRAIEWPDDELAVFATLKGPLFAVGDEALLEYRHSGENGRRRLHPFWTTGELPEHLEPVRRALETLAELHRERNRRPVAETVHRLIDATRAHALFVLRPSGEQALANVLHVAEQARAYEGTGGISFRGFVERLLEDAGGRKASEAPILEEGSEGVRLMTVHRAKGLEFPVVILADMTADIARSTASRVIEEQGADGRPACAVRISGWAPHELTEQQAREVQRDQAEGVRLAYVAATRARDLLVVPAVGDAPYGEPDGETLGGWIHPLNDAIYPSQETQWESKEAANCPKFGRDTVLDRPHDPDADPGIRPGRHDIEDRSVVWWDPAALRLGVEMRQGIRREELLSREVEADVVAKDVERFRAWERERAATLATAAVPSVRPIPARDWASARAKAEGPNWAAAIGLVELPRDKRRPAGRRFGLLVHALLAVLPLDADAERTTDVAELQGRILGATDDEVAAAARAARRVLEHELFERVREAQERGDVRRETPLSLAAPDGQLVEGGRRPGVPRAREERRGLDRRGLQDRRRDRRGPLAVPRPGAGVRGDAARGDRRGRDGVAAPGVTRSRRALVAGSQSSRRLAADWPDCRQLSCPLVASRHHPTVDVPDRARHPARIFRQQVVDDRRHVVRLADAPDGVEAVEALQRLLDLVRLDEGAVDRRHHDRRRHGVHANPIVGQLHCEVLREGVQAGLRHRVRGGRRRLHRLPRPHRADVHDRAAAVRLHALRRGLGNEERGAVELVVVVVVFLGMLEERLRAEVAGRVHEIPDGAELVEFGDEPVDGRLVREVEPGGRDVAEGGQLADRFVEPLARARDQMNALAPAEETLRRRFAHARGTADDQRRSHDENLYLCIGR